MHALNKGNEWMNEWMEAGADISTAEKQVGFLCLCNSEQNGFADVPANMTFKHT